MQSFEGATKLKQMKVKIGVSACLLGQKCNFNGQDLFNAFVDQISKSSEVEIIAFCPEDFIFGTPRANLRIVGGDGNDVLDGLAKVIDEHGNDVTQKQILGAKEFLERLQSQNVDLVFLMEGSPSCGVNVLLNENDWPRGGFKRGSGVAAALLKRNGIEVVGSFDEKSISEALQAKQISFHSNKSLMNLKDLPQFKMLFEI